MQEELAAIDVSPLESLMGIKAELETLEARLTAMEERKDSVAAPVFVRVRNDYETRRKSLEAEAAPLKAAAQAQYVKLAALLSRSAADHEAARLDREEIEFRHALGEFDNAEFKRKLSEIDHQLAAKSAAREEALAVRQRFVDAFRSEAELESKLPPVVVPKPAPPPEPVIVAPVVIAPEPEPEPEPIPVPVVEPEPEPIPRPAAEQTTRRLPTLDMALKVPQIDVPTLIAKPITANSPPPPSAPPAAAGATQIMRAIKPSELAAASAAPAGPPALPRAPEPVAGTIRSARLVPQNAEAGKLSHTIGAKPLTIGSGESCDIRVGGASARHAEVRASMAGMTVSDLGGGVRINGVVIEQHLLRHEDVLEVGPARFTFREA
ncbi:MAG: FHA domain-containing protein [Pseudomarimonas sp.]